MTLKDWLKLNPNHRAVVTASPGDELKVVLTGGDAAEGPYRATGVELQETVDRALEVRALVRSARP
jgi:hypothetical protein